MIDRKIFICDCSWLEHSVSVWYDEEDDLFYFEPRLITHRNFFKRLWVGLKYAFGYKSRYGEWDSIILKPADRKELMNYLLECNMHRGKFLEKFKNKN